MTSEQLDIYKRMSGEEKLAVALNLYHSARRLKRAAIESQHPEWSRQQIEKALKEAFLYART